MTTPNLDIPELLPAQSLPEATINDALRRIDALLSLGVETFKTLTAPPGSPAEGDMHVVDSPATGAWAGHEDEIAYRAFATWEFIQPAEGVMIWKYPTLYIYTLAASPSGWTAMITI